VLSIYIANGEQFGFDCLNAVMAGPVPAIHVVLDSRRCVDARVKPGHDEQLIGSSPLS